MDTLEATMEVKILGDEVLRAQAQNVVEVDEQIKALIKEMFITMEEERGIGLAAPQIGRSIRLFVCHADKDKQRVFINPELLSTSEELSDYEEGCLSIPGLYADIKRPRDIKVQAYNEKGRPFTLEASGLLARVIQHELDHLNGKLFIDHIPDMKRTRLVEQWEKARKV